MTDFWRKAAEAAGLRYHTTPGPWFELPNPGKVSWRWRASDPALLPFIASRLAQQAQEVIGWSFSVFPQSRGQWLVHVDGQDSWGDTLEEATARAALAVLGVEDE